MNLNHIQNTEWLCAPATQKIFETLHQCGFTARIVGGAVRNAILGTVIKDIDFATNASPDQVIACAKQADIHVIPTGLHHGTVTLVVDHQAFEITTLRMDVETDGRWAKVSFTDDWLEDARRRDFTMNALYVDRDGEIFDPLGGYQDLIEKRVRFIGTPEDRIREDYLRILRYFRFKAEYGLSTLDLPSLSACVRHRAGLRGLSSERIAGELLRLLTAKDAESVVTLMFDYGLLVDLLACPFHFKRFQKLIALEANLRQSPNEITRLAALTLMTGEDAARLARRLRLSNTAKHQLALMSELFQNPSASSLPSENEAKTLLYTLRPDDYRIHIQTRWLLSPDTTHDPHWQQHYALPDHWAIPKFPIKGEDLLKLGLTSGPALGQILKKLETIWMTEKFSPSRDILLKMVFDLLSNDKKRQ